MFPMRSGAGLMGESGPEAIMPLTRRGGKLGVEGSSAPVYVNIINNSGNDVETKETTGSGGERQLEVIINSAVKKGIASGSYDRAFGESYGLNRRGR
jgi:phage-related minor tail protein